MQVSVMRSEDGGGRVLQRYLFIDASVLYACVLCSVWPCVALRPLGASLI
jgi:hypothetical protein